MFRLSCLSSQLSGFKHVMCVFGKYHRTEFILFVTENIRHKSRYSTVATTPIKLKMGESANLVNKCV